MFIISVITCVIGFTVGFGMYYKQSRDQQQRDLARVERGKVRRAASPVSMDSPTEFESVRAVDIGDSAPPVPQRGTAAYSSVHAYMARVQSPADSQPTPTNLYDNNDYGSGVFPNQPPSTRGEQIMSRRGLNEALDDPLDNDPLLGDYSQQTRPNPFGMSPQQSHSYENPRKQSTIRWGSANHRNEEPQDEYGIL